MARITQRGLFFVLFAPIIPNTPPLLRILIGIPPSTHQQRQQLQQKLADASLDLMHLERFIGYASTG
jgi:hypothetical protein